MARPGLADIVNGAEGWDAVLNDWRAKLVDAPFPIFRVANTTALDAITASDYEHCLAVVDATHGLYLSNDKATPGTWVWTQLVAVP